MQKALGVIECRGLATAIEAADAAVKAANVTIGKSYLKASGGKVNILIRGDVAAVKSAVDAGVASASQIGEVQAQVVIPRMATDFLKPVLGTIDGTLDKVKFRWSRNRCVCVVMASGGYPGTYKKGHQIKGIEEAERYDGTVVFHAGTRNDGEKDLSHLVEGSSVSRPWDPP